MYFLTSYIKVTVSTVPTEWYHLVFNYVSGSPATLEGITIYHDGVEVGSGTQKTSHTTNAGQGVVVIGRYFAQAHEQDFASVMVDELLFFNRNLSPDEVSILYNMHK